MLLSPGSSLMSSMDDQQERMANDGLRDQVIGLISDAQTADKTEKEYLLTQVGPVPLLSL